MNTSKSFIAVLIFSSVLTLQAQAADVDLSIEPIDGMKGYKRVVATSLIHASIDRVWSDLVEYQNIGHHNSMLGVGRVANIGDGKNRHEISLNVGFPFPLPKLTCEMIFTKDEAQHAITFDRKAGCFKHNNGSIVLESRGDDTLLTFAAEIEVGHIMPDWAFAWAFERNVPMEIARLREATSTTFAATR